MKNQGEVNVAEVDASKNSGCATRFNVRAFPSLKLFHQVRSIAQDRPPPQFYLCPFGRL